MASFQITLRIFAIAIFLYLNGPIANCQENTLEERLFAAMSLLNDVAELYPVNNILNLTTFAERRTFLDTLKSLASFIAYQHSLEGIFEFEDDVFAAVANDACSWVRTTIEDESFNCSEAELDSLITHVELNLSSALIVRQFKRVCRTCTRNVNEQIKWVIDNIPCTGNGRLTRNYLANNHAAFAEAAEIRCPSTTTIPATMMS